MSVCTNSKNCPYNVFLDSSSAQPRDEAKQQSSLIVTLVEKKEFAVFLICGYATTHLLDKSIRVKNRRERERKLGKGRKQKEEVKGLGGEGRGGRDRSERGKIRQGDEGEGGGGREGSLIREKGTREGGERREREE